jgi:hypothetical protein
VAVAAQAEGACGCNFAMMTLSGAKLGPGVAAFVDLTPEQGDEGRS